MARKVKKLKNKKVVKHLKSDMKMFKREAAEDKKLIKHLSAKVKPKAKKVKEAKVKKVMDEYKMGELHSGSKKGPLVTNPKQAIAIALSESRRLKKKKVARKK